MPTVEKLIEKITLANKAYRDGSPIMSDQDFDDLCESLKFLMDDDDKYSAFIDTLHEVAGKVKHPFIMGSLDKLKYDEPKTVREFISTCCSDSLNVSAKVDGISCRLHYKNGQLVSATTRGDGEFGVDLTDKIDFVKFIPERIKNDKHNTSIDSLDIRGELVILKKDFSEIEESFANPRNAVAGIVNRKDWVKEDVSNVSFIAYTVLGSEFTKEEQFKLLEDWGFKTAWNKTFSKDYFSSKGLDVVEELFKYASQSFEYETDGLVICSGQYRNEEKYRPTAQKAFKINQQIAETRLIDISWEGPSKDGVFVPVALISPVELGGATVSRVTLHNLDLVESKGIMYGSKIRIRRSGDVIPYLEAVVENPAGCTPVEVVDTCPCCGSKLVRDGVNMRCMNKDCPDQVIHRIVGFFKKLGVKNASNATLKKMGITSFDALLQFKPDGKHKSETKLYDELMVKMFTQPKEKLLGAMNFVGLSEVLIGKIVSQYGFSMIESKTFRDVVKKSTLPAGIGDATIDAFLDGLDDALRTVHLIVDDTRWHGDVSQSSSNVAPVKGSICVTGSLNFGSREKFLEFAREHGYESKSGVSKGLSYLVNNDINSSSSKNKKAKELGIKIITEDEFMKMVKDDELESDVFAL